MDTRHKTAAKEAADVDTARRMKEVDELAMTEKKVSAGGAAPDLPVPGTGGGGAKQRPLADDVKDAAKGAKEGIKDAVHGVTGPGDGSEKSVAGRKMMKDESGRAVVGKDDGVAKVGNTGQKEQGVVKDEEGPDTLEDHEVEVELNSILKKSPSKYTSSSRGW